MHLILSICNGLQRRSSYFSAYFFVLTTSYTNTDMQNWVFYAIFGWVESKIGEKIGWRKWRGKKREEMNWVWMRKK